ncbi:MAG: hypothetical protein JKY54_08730, partial [Flavobacteriales bacterium]|nr:hypothetical protein [Flavobacteriales bacterium]
MSSITEPIKIPKDVSSKDDLDFDFLKSEGIKYIESMGGGLWTDFNVHDPGITFLEMLCYAITDLGNRIKLPIEDLLTSEKDLELRNQFYRASEILPACPLTALDYRKIFADIPGVRNSWIIKFDKVLHINCKDSQIAYSEESFGALDAEFKDTVNLQGLNEVIVDYDLTVTDEGGALLDIETINNSISKKYHANRNLCEDLVKITEVSSHKIGVCADIELEKEADEDLVHANILDAIENYFTPEIQYYSIKEMLDKGYRTDEIFEGPRLENGFIDPKEMADANLRSEVRLSDIVHEIMSIEGVKLIKDISIRDCKKNKDGKDWLICIDQYTKPTLCSTIKEDGCCATSVFNYVKDVLPITYNPKKVEEFRDKLKEEKQLKNDIARLNKTLKIKKGKYLNPAETTTIQNDFPDVYGISPFGLPGSVSVKRKSEAVQLKGYLAFFDQILASYFAHLGKVKDLLSINTGVAPTYFTQAIKDIRGFDDLVKDYPQNDDALLANKLLSKLDDHIDRRNDLLDHLLARFAEEFSEFTFLMRELYGAVSNELVLQSKEQFLKEYVELSCRRGHGYNIIEERTIDPDTGTDLAIWDTDNISGAQKRIARLTGIRNYVRRNLSASYVKILEKTKEETVNGEQVTITYYEWVLTDSFGLDVLESTMEYTTSARASKELYFAIFQLINTSIDEVEDQFNAGVVDGTVIQNITVVEHTSSQFTFNVINPEEPISSTDRILAVHRPNDYYNNTADLKQAIIDVIKFIKEEFSEEGIFLIEH